MQIKLGNYVRGFKDVPQLPKTSNSANSAKSWAIPVRMFVDTQTGESKKVLLVGFAPRLRYVPKTIAQEILNRYSGFERIKFLPRRFIPMPVEEKLQIQIVIQGHSK